MGVVLRSLLLASSILLLFDFVFELEQGGALIRKFLAILTTVVLG